MPRLDLGHGPNGLDWIDVARFWSRVAVASPTDCWLWRGPPNSDGYGECKAAGERQMAHRVAHQIGWRVSVEGIVVRHRCDTPACCNPAHTLTGTDLDNVADRVERERSAKGEVNGRAVLTEDDVLRIRADGRSNRVLADLYGVHRDTIRAIRDRKTWRHVQ